MTHDQNLQLDTQTQQHKALLVFRVFRVGNDTGMFIEEGSARLFKRHTVLGLISTVLPRIPFEADIGHPYIVNTT